jgi:ABC-type transport system involved in cytochrome bd biosynthesis fused ATPase/permease subunit
MNLPNEALYFLITVIFISLAMTLVGLLTKDSRNFRGSRNKRARKQL